MVDRGAVRLAPQPATATSGDFGRPSQLVHAFQASVVPQSEGVTSGTWTYNRQPERSWDICRGLIFGPW